MKLKYMYEFKTDIHDQLYDSHKSLFRVVDDNEVEFLFDDGHNLIGINVFLTNVKPKINTAGELDPNLANEDNQKAHSIASYIADRFFDLTQRSEFSYRNIARYLPETQGETKELEGMTYAKLKRSGSLEVLVHGDILSEDELNKYKGQKDPYAMFIDAKRMTHLVGKYRELYRILDHFFPDKNEELFVRKTYSYLARFDPRYTETLIRNFRSLRNRCSHGKQRRNFITSNDYKGLKEIQDKIGDISLAARILLDNPPP